MTRLLIDALVAAVLAVALFALQRRAWPCRESEWRDREPVRSV